MATRVQELVAEIEQLSPEEQEEILNAEIPEEIEKQASEEVSGSLLADSLYNYGWLQAQRSFAEFESGGNLSKIASEEQISEQEELEEQVADQIEGAISELGTAEAEGAELHKEAQAAAALIFAGYSDALEKIAASKGKSAGSVMKFLNQAKGKAKETYRAAEKGAKKGGRYVKRQAAPIAGGAAVGAAGAAGLMAYGRKKGEMDKRASELSVGELLDLAREEDQLARAVEEGVEKLAAKAKEKAAKSIFSSLRKQMGKGTAAVSREAKRVGKHVSKNRYAYGGGLAASGAGFAAGRASSD